MNILREHGIALIVGALATAAVIAWIAIFNGCANALPPEQPIQMTVSCASRDGGH